MTTVSRLTGTHAIWRNQNLALTTDQRRHRWSIDAANDLRRDRLLQKFQRFQFVQSTRACLTCQRLDQCFCYRCNTVKIVQAGHGSEGEWSRVGLRIAEAGNDSGSRVPVWLPGPRHHLSSGAAAGKVVGEIIYMSLRADDDRLLSSVTSAETGEGLC